MGVVVAAVTVAAKVDIVVVTIVAAATFAAKINIVVVTIVAAAVTYGIPRRRATPTHW